MERICQGVFGVEWRDLVWCYYSESKTNVGLALKEVIWVGVGGFSKVEDWHERRNLVGWEWEDLVRWGLA